MFGITLSKVRILVVSQYFWPEAFRINEITKTLVEQGHHVDVLTGQPNYPEGIIHTGYRAWSCGQEDFHLGVTVSRVPLIPRGKNSKVRLAINYLSFIVFGSLFGPWVQRGRSYDVIFVYGLSPLLLALPGLLLGWIKKVPVVIWVQDLWPQSLSATGYVRNRFILGAVERVVRFIYRYADLLLVQSRAFVELVRQLADGTPIKYYPNSVDGSFINPSMEKNLDVFGLDALFSVMFTGNIGFAQAVDVIVDAATLLKEYQDIHFIVLGDGSRREWMLQQAKQRGLVTLHLPGRFPIETMPGFMQKASVLLVTLADCEIFAATVPNKIQAYMAVGQPIIACMNGEGAQLVTEAQAGLSVSAEDGDGLAQAILALYRMSLQERNRMGTNAQAYYRDNFNHESWFRN